MSQITKAVFALLLFFALANAQPAQRSRNPHGPVKIACEACHTSTSWTPVRPHPEFDHNKQTAYPLRGMHVDVQCSQCHVKPVFKAAPKDCASCHADLHRGQMGNNCEQCHNLKGWKAAVQQSRDHANRFPLFGAHATVPCESCHRNAAAGAFKGLSTECVTCHLNVYVSTQSPPHQAAGFPQNCAACHSMNSWLGAKFDHLAIAHFALDGAHRTLECQSCHVGGRYAGTPAACVNCHLNAYQTTTNPNHAAANFPQQCATCHTTASWLGAKFNHGITGFALTGAHVTAQCSQCHPGNQFAGISTACISCHLPDYQATKNPNHVAGNFPKDCSVCHTTSMWQGAKFDHSATPFPLTGAHLQLQCAQCHIGGNFAGTPTACVGCHLPDFKGTTNPNHVTAGFPQDCTLCHTTAQWPGAKFDHANTGFALIGAHAPLQCNQCHTGSTYSGLSKSCDSCHLPDYKSATNPNHVQAAYPLDCSLCHTAVQWAGAKFDHTSAGGFALTGAHTTLQCNQCHTGGTFASAPRTCDGCHLALYKTTTNPNHVQASFPTDCSLCHTTVQWAGATFNHSAASGFPLTGAHTTLQCSQCHTNGNFTTAPRTCDGCHLALFKSTTNPNHAQAGFPVDCSVCHTTAQWAGAQFDHSRTKFPLTGAHTTVQCTTCHTSGPYASAPVNCDACHLAQYKSTTNPNHITAGFPLDCSLCHSTTGWPGAVFDHSKLAFPLTGAHLTVQCALCHVGGHFAGTPTDCYSCHKTVYQSVQNPNHIAANFPTTCATCHTTAAWTGATFAHTRFPITTGTHAKVWTSCADCHVDPANYNTFSCINCHTHTQASTDPHHRGVRGYSYAPTTCYQCHPTGGGR